MKYGNYDKKVAPFTGAWIEIALDVGGDIYANVAPFTGAWIEIQELEKERF